MQLGRVRDLPGVVGHHIEHQEHPVGVHGVVQRFEIPAGAKAQVHVGKVGRQLYPHEVVVVEPHGLLHDGRDSHHVEAHHLGVV